MFKLSKNFFNFIKIPTLIFLVSFGINVFTKAELTEQKIVKAIGYLVEIGVLEQLEQKDSFFDLLLDENENNIKELKEKTFSLAKNIKMNLRQDQFIQNKAKEAITVIVNAIMLKTPHDQQFKNSIDEELRHNFAEFYRN